MLIILWTDKNDFNQLFYLDLRRVTQDHLRQQYSWNSVVHCTQAISVCHHENPGFTLSPTAWRGPVIPFFRYWMYTHFIYFALPHQFHIFYACLFPASWFFGEIFYLMLLTSLSSFLYFRLCSIFTENIKSTLAISIFVAFRNKQSLLKSSEIFSQPWNYISPNKFISIFRHVKCLRAKSSHHLHPFTSCCIYASCLSLFTPHPCLYIKRILLQVK